MTNQYPLCAQYGFEGNTFVKVKPGCNGFIETQIIGTGGKTATDPGYLYFNIKGSELVKNPTLEALEVCLQAILDVQQDTDEEWVAVVMDSTLKKVKAIGEDQ